MWPAARETLLIQRASIHRNYCAVRLGSFARFGPGCSSRNFEDTVHSFSRQGSAFQTANRSTLRSIVPGSVDPSLQYLLLTQFPDDKRASCSTQCSNYDQGKLTKTQFTQLKSGIPLLLYNLQKSCFGKKLAWCWGKMDKTVTTLILTSFLACIAWIVYTSLVHPLSSFPGPVWARVSRFWYIHQVWKGHLDETWKRLHEQYGAFVRVAPDEISITDPTTITKVLDAKGTFPKAEIYSVFEGPNGRFANLVTIRDERQHSQRRRAVGSLYSTSSVSQTEGAIDAMTNKLMKQVAFFSLTKTPFDLAEWLQRWVYSRFT